MVARYSPCPAAVARKNACGKKAVIGNSTLLLLATSAKYFPFRPTRARSSHLAETWKSPIVVFQPRFLLVPSTAVFRWTWPIREIQNQDSVEGNRAHARVG